MLTKVCTVCQIDKPISEYSIDSRRAIGVRCECKECQRRRRKSRAKVYQQDPNYRTRTEKPCSLCHLLKPISEFSLHGTTRDGYQTYCKSCDRDRDRTYRQNYTRQYMIGNAKRRAKVDGVPFSLTLSDISIPECCPVLGIPLSVGQASKHTDNSPTIDRILPELGYIPGNVAVISFRANRIKNDATLDELRKVAEWLAIALATSAPVG